MKVVGIEAINAYAGRAYLDVKRLAEFRKLDMARFDNLLMKEKTVALPHEDPVTFGVNAAKPLIDALGREERDKIEMIVTCTESSFDFGKSMSTYFHHHLGIKRNCRLFELKNACYSGIAGLQVAANFVLSQASPGAKALVIATDVSRFFIEKGGEALTQDWAFAEPSGGSGAVAILVSEQPDVFQMDVGANGYYGYEVMDTCRPAPDSEAGDAELSLLSYLDCCENAFKEYQKRVDGADYAKSFHYLAFHTPFGGMIKGAHRKLMRKMSAASAEEIERDFGRRVQPGLTYCQRVGNSMGATTMLSLLSTIDNGDFSTPKRIGCFSYGSGCCSEFFSGFCSRESQERVRALQIREHLDKRYELSMDEYHELLSGERAIRFGTRNVKVETDFAPRTRTGNGRELLFLKGIREYHREYEWIS
jgi:polyketide biosynthesis 3-hydroxy-3-methylglutaryl-CoA synthase-like enzyme PksG